MDFDIIKFSNLKKSIKLPNINDYTWENVLKYKLLKIANDCEYCKESEEYQGDC